MTPLTRDQHALVAYLRRWMSRRWAVSETPFPFLRGVKLCRAEILAEMDRIEREGLP